MSVSRGSGRQKASLNLPVPGNVGMLQGAHGSAGFLHFTSGSLPWIIKAKWGTARKEEIKSMNCSQIKTSVMSHVSSWPQHKAKWRWSVSSRSGHISGNPLAAAIRHDVKLRTLHGQWLTLLRSVRKSKVFCSVSERAGYSVWTLYSTQQS